MSFDVMVARANLRKFGIPGNSPGGGRLSAFAGAFGRAAGMGAPPDHSAAFRSILIAPKVPVPKVPVFKVPEGVISGLAGAGGSSTKLFVPKTGAGASQAVGVGAGLKPLMDRMNVIAGTGVKPPPFKPPAWAGVLAGVPREPLIPVSPVAKMISALGAPGKATALGAFPVIGAERDRLCGTIWKLAGLGERASAAAVLKPLPGWLGKMGPGVPSFAAGIGGFETGPLYGGWSGTRKVIEDLARARDLLAPHRERWARLAEELAEWAAREAARTTPEDRLAAAAFGALEALEDGRHWETDKFLKKHLNIRPHPRIRPYVYQALWMLLKADFDRPFDSPAKWRTLELRKATAYLSTAIYNEARRLKRDTDKLDELWWGDSAEPPFIVPEVFPTGEQEDHADAVAVLLDGRPPDDRALVLESLSINGTSGDREVVRLIRDGGRDRAGIRNEVGSPRLQAFERKARRWRSDEKF